MRTFLYIPNLIGYLRIALLVFAFSVRNENYGLFFCSYFLSFALDMADGIAARAFGQSSRFGAVLDMLTDRITSLVMALICVGVPNSSLSTYITIWIAIDIASHWWQTLNAAAKKQHHKEMNNRFLLLNFYYSNKSFMGTLCVGAELFYLFHFYKITHKSVGIIFTGIYYAMLILMSTKGYINVLQLISNALATVEDEEKELDKEKPN